jgi:thiamine-monophosphate kinase
MSLEDIAYKAMIVNISDAIAMNAKPIYALVNIAIPKNFTNKELKELASGFKRAKEEFEFEIIGGDTIASIKLDISITLISKTKRPIFRKPIKKGYILGYTGEIGEAKKELKTAFRTKRAKGKLLKPKLRQKFISRAARHIKAAMDISDGLFDDLQKLATLNKIGFEFFKKIPKKEGCSGEEYELLFAIDKRDIKKILAISKITRTKVTFFALAKGVKYKNSCKPNHF